MGVEFGITRDFATWKAAIKGFLRNRPELTGSNTRGYFWFLADRGCISLEEAEKLCALVKQGVCPKPEVYVRCRRELIEHGEVYVQSAQKSMLEEAQVETRQYYRGKK